MHSAEYWQKRATENEQRSHEMTEERVKKLHDHYESAAEEIEGRIATFFTRYANEQGISYEEAKKLLTAKETKQWLKSLGEYMAEIKALPDGDLKERLQAELDARAYASRISRLDALKAQLDLAIDRLMLNAETEMGDGLSDIYSEEYYHKIFNIQQRVGRMFPFAHLNEEMVKEVLFYPWSGADFSARLWRNKTALRFHAREILTQGVIQGKSVTAMAKELEKKMKSSYSAAETLIRTESSRIHNDADKNAYEAAGVEWYEFMATNQESTCEHCGELDGQTFKLEEAKTGINYPPIHPRCRCTTVEYDPDEWRDWDAVGQPMPQRMTYKEWHEKEIDAKRLKNAAGYDIIRVKKVTRTAAPNSITEFISAKGGKDRNFYDDKGRQYKQISNNGHGHKKEEALGRHGEHAHDYFWDDDGNMTRSSARELTEKERSENSDFL